MHKPGLPIIARLLFRLGLKDDRDIDTPPAEESTEEFLARITREYELGDDKDEDTSD